MYNKRLHYCLISSRNQVVCRIINHTMTLTLLVSALFMKLCGYIQHQHVIPRNEERMKRSGVTYWFYDALCTGEHGTHDGKVLGVRHPPLAHVFEDFSCCWSSQRVFGVEANIGIDASCEDTKSSSEDKPCGEQKHQRESLPNESQQYLQTRGIKRCILWRKQYFP